MDDPVYNVLSLCTGNSAYSIVAASILRRDGAGRFKTFSEGSNPNGEVNPLALKTLKALHFPTDGLCLKSWDKFALPGRPKMDFVFTVCDNAAGASRLSKARTVFPTLGST